MNPTLAPGIFSLEQFYQTYNIISTRDVSRTVPSSPSQEVKTHQNSCRKRISSGSSEGSTEESCPKRPRLSTGSSSDEESVVKSSGTWVPQHENIKPGLKLVKSKSKKIKKQKSLKKDCSCRFCYEDHILRMRMKRFTHFSPIVPSV